MTNNMKSRDIETVLIGGLKEVLQDPAYFYKSTAGPEYCHLTDLGKEVIFETVNMLGARLLVAMVLEDVERSKQLVLDELKGK
jgi:hypothetical protein